MTIQTVAEIRQAFLDYFASKAHSIVASSPLVPGNDPTLLFTNAGMVQFKETFLGLEPRPYSRATTCQRCVRAGGKHNDLENVGYTARHHTFFEMLGNFSFGDYFKREAIQFAWEFLTDVLKLPKEKLWITVYQEDDEAADIWLKELKVDATRFSRCGAKDNFWMMGDTGPCGPCSEIFYDHGEHVAGGPPGSPDADGDRYIEIWNLVFMQFNRDAQGTLTPLPKPSVDTGMGLERLAAVLQHVHSNYEIDLFQTIIKQVAALTHCEDIHNTSLRVIADHIRACSFLIADGVVPSNEGRGYVLRRIIRRALRHGHKLGTTEPFFYRLVSVLVQEMGKAYPELPPAQATVERILKQEEERFAETLDHGMRLLEQSIGELKGSTTIVGETVFKLYDTYGFPVDLTADIARERNLSVDIDGFEVAMEAQRARARASSQFKGTWVKGGNNEHVSEFTGYELQQQQSTVIALFADGQAVQSLSAGQAGQVVLDNTPFYAESGGQVGDLGVLTAANASFSVTDTQKQTKAIVHIGTLSSGSLKVGDSVLAEVNITARQATSRNHSATHLLHAALRQILGEHVKQKGSLVDPERLRFDFAHFEPITAAQLIEIEKLVNAQVLLNSPVQTNIMDLEEATKSGAMALFGEKYDAKVRVLSIGEFSTELCGGIHVHHAGDIGLFKIMSETGIAAGVRRVEAITGLNALSWVHHTDNTLAKLASLLKTGRDSLEERLQLLLEQNKAAEKELGRLQAQIASAQGNNLISQAQDIQGVKVLAACLDNIEAKQLRETLVELNQKMGSSVIVLATVKEGKISLVAGSSADIMGKVKAGELVNHVALQVGGKGGGRADIAQAGGTNPDNLPQALQSVAAWIAQKLG
ncbi:MAG: alanine--tRNA ligase [Thiotrichaceae bacterium]|nr:alanine--tRNA ligase [Thiotrichaceae bacterium]